MLEFKVRKFITILEGYEEEDDDDCEEFGGPHISPTYNDLTPLLTSINDFTPFLEPIDHIIDSFGDGLTPLFESV